MLDIMFEWFILIVILDNVIVVLLVVPCVPEKLVLNLPWYIRTGVPVKTNDTCTVIVTDEVFLVIMIQTGTVLNADRSRQGQCLI